MISARQYVIPWHRDEQPLGAVYGTMAFDPA